MIDENCLNGNNLFSRKEPRMRFNDMNVLKSFGILDSDEEFQKLNF